MDAQQAADLAISIGDRLCDEAIVADDRATWRGAQQAFIDDEWQVVEETIGADLYGGAAGVALFLARLGASAGGSAHRDYARLGARQALALASGDDLGPSLYAGTSGIAAAVAEVGQRCDDDDLVDQAHELTIAEPDAADLIAGSSGMIIAALALHRDRPDEGWLDRAIAWGHDLLDRGETSDDGTQRWWPSADGADEPPLLGLGHGASGCAWPLAELAVATHDLSWFDPVGQAVAYERSWLDIDRGNWPDLRELGEQARRSGAEPSWPAFWCHGAPGIGLTRLRFFELTGDERHADEARIAIVTAMRFAAEMSRAPTAHDASLCHGLAGVIELLREAATVLGEPEHLDAAFEVGDIVDQMSRGGEWPSGVRDGGENPSLMLGMAGTGGALLNLAHDAPASYGLLWKGEARSTRITAKAAEPAEVPTLARRLAEAAPGIRLERASRSGRMLFVAPAMVDPQSALAAMSADPDVDWAELDQIDRRA